MGLVLGLVPVGFAQAASWTQTDLVDGWSNGAPALAVRSDDKVGIAYERVGTSPGILYQTNAGGSWDETRISSGDDWVPDIAFDGSDHAHVAFAHFGTTPGIYYATDATGSWATSLAAGDDAWAPSIAVDGAGKIHIAYASTNFSPGIFYLTNASGDWVRTQISSGTWDDRPSIALDGSGKVHVAFARYQPETRGLYYATNASGSWVSTRVTTGADDSPSLAIDDAGHPHIAFLATNRTGLAFAENVAGSWTVDVLPGSYQSGQTLGTPSLAIAPDDAFHIVAPIYPAPGSYGVTLHHWVGSTGSWTGSADIPTDQGPLFDTEPSLGFLSTGGVELAFTRDRPSAGVMVYEFGCCPTMLAASSADGPPALGQTSGGDGRLIFERRDGTSGNGVVFGAESGTSWSFDRIGNHTGGDRSGLALAPDDTARAVLGSYYGSNDSGSWVSDTSLSFDADSAVAVDSTGHAHVAYADEFIYWTLHYRTNVTGSWVDEALTGSYEPPGSRPAIALDSSDKAYVAYAIAGDVWYTTNKTGTWSEPVKVTLRVDDNAPGASDPAIALDAAGHISLAWNQTAGGAGTYYATNATGSWVRTRLTRTYASEPPSMVLNASGKVFVAVARAWWAANPGVYLSTNRTGSWVTSEVLESFGATGTPIVVGPGDLARIAYDNDDWGVSLLDQTSLTPTILRDPAAMRALRQLGRLPGMIVPGGPAASVRPAHASSGPTAPQVSGGAGFGR
jgi:hypothetical protein